jgi:hypothetical protein
MVKCLASAGMGLAQIGALFHEGLDLGFEYPLTHSPALARAGQGALIGDGTNN